MQEKLSLEITKQSFFFELVNILTNIFPLGINSMCFCWPENSFVGFSFDAYLSNLYICIFTQFHVKANLL